MYSGCQAGFLCDFFGDFATVRVGFHIFGRLAGAKDMPRATGGLWSGPGAG